ncbi:MAG: hypothetical protein II901_04785 [Paludibacteraceae bacterium]|nr:hypothetical protein [Paludibacteraceae bacterium]
MKKITLFILCLLCTITASALSYASPYKGAGRGGYIYTTSAVHQRAASAGMAQAPVASMTSTGSSMGRGIASAATPVTSTPSVRGIQTSASRVSGGITTVDSYHPKTGPRRSPTDPPVPDDACGECHWHWDPNAGDDGQGDWVCEVCGSWYSYGCDHVYEEGYCWCPIGDGWEVWLFVAVLAGAYALYKVRAGKKSNGDVRDANDMRMRMTAI